MAPAWTIDTTLILFLWLQQLLSINLRGTHVQSHTLESAHTQTHILYLTEAPTRAVQLQLQSCGLLFELNWCFQSNPNGSELQMKERAELAFYTAHPPQHGWKHSLQRDRHWCFFMSWKWKRFLENHIFLYISTSGFAVRILAQVPVQREA